jgi:PAS domain S-box-containing protein
VKYPVNPTQIERVMRDEDFIVSKTDLSGRITYANKIFLEFSGYAEKEILGAQHNIIRHPDMPRGIFKFAWDALHKKHEVQLYVKNLSADGGFYWVFATMSPSFDSAGKVIGYYSVRRAPERAGVKAIEVIYQQMLAEEVSVAREMQPEASLKWLKQLLDAKGMSYADFVLSL